MKVLAFDTETTGLPASYNLSLTDVAKWPHVLQLSYIVFDTVTKEIIDYTDHIIRLDDDVAITADSIAIHHITKERSQHDGIPMSMALWEFSQAAREADIIVGHNIQFDKNMLTVEFHRNNMPNGLYRDGQPLPEYCTMKETVDFCKLPRLNTTSRMTNFQYKWPTLAELHTCLFKAQPKGTHNAIADVMICLRCYIYLHYGYDIAFDKGVKVIFRALYSSYCLAPSPYVMMTSTPNKSGLLPPGEADLPLPPPPAPPQLPLRVNTDSLLMPPPALPQRNTRNSHYMAYSGSIKNKKA